MLKAKKNSMKEFYLKPWLCKKTEREREKQQHSRKKQSKKKINRTLNKKKQLVKTWTNTHITRKRERRDVDDNHHDDEKNQFQAPFYWSHNNTLTKMSVIWNYVRHNFSSMSLFFFSLFLSLSFIHLGSKLHSIFATTVVVTFTFIFLVPPFLSLSKLCDRR